MAMPACGRDVKATPSPVLSARETLLKARTAMSEVSRFRFELTHPAGTTSLPGGLFLTRADGAVIAPDRLSINAEANFSRVFVKVRAVVIGDETYMTNFLTGAWSKVPPGESPFGFLDPVKLVADMLGQVTAPEFEPKAKPDGDLVIRGRISAGPFAALVGMVDDSKTVDVSLAVDRRTFLLKEALVQGAVQPEDGPTVARLIRLSGFDDEIAIERPI
jgi:hypothetical protein